MSQNFGKRERENCKDYLAAIIHVCVHSGLIKYRKMCNLGKPYCFGSEDKINGFKKKSNRAVTKRPSEEITKTHLF